MSPSISEEIKTRVRQEASDRCGYCLSKKHKIRDDTQRESIVTVLDPGTYYVRLYPPHHLPSQYRFTLEQARCPFYGWGNRRSPITPPKTIR